jgi:hypothetical protein
MKGDQFMDLAIVSLGLMDPLYKPSVGNESFV